MTHQPAPPAARLLLVGFSALLARSLVRCLRREHGAEVAALAPSLARAALLPIAPRLDLALVTWPALDRGSATIVRLRDAHPGVRIACVACDAESYRSAARGAGADLFFVDDRLYEDLRAALVSLAVLP